MKALQILLRLSVRSQCRVSVAPFSAAKSSGEGSQRGKWRDRTKTPADSAWDRLSDIVDADAGAS